MGKIEKCIGNYEGFLDKFLSEVTGSGFDLNDFSQLDHICYRTTSQENYLQKKLELSRFGDLLTEAQISGRPISVFRLNHPIIFDRWRIDCIELPAPKEGSSHQEGLEHGEFVLYDDFSKFKAKHSDKNFNLESEDRGINPEISYKMPTYGVKFHLLSLPTVVFLEQKLGQK